MGGWCAEFFKVLENVFATGNGVFIAFRLAGGVGIVLYSIGYRSRSGLAGSWHGYPVEKLFRQYTPLSIDKPGASSAECAPLF
jgi:hypothetical protein